MGKISRRDSQGLWPSPEWRRAPAVFAFFVLADDEQWVS